MQRLHLLLLLALLLIGVLVQLSPSLAGAAAFALVVGVSSAASPSIGLAALLISMPVAALLGESVSGALLMLGLATVGGLFGGIFLRSMLGGGPAFLVAPDRQVPLVLGFLVCFFALSSTLLNGFGAGIWNLVSTALSIIAFLALVATVRNEGARPIVELAVFASATAAGVFALREYAFGAARLEVGDSVRPLANHVGLAIVLLLPGFLTVREQDRGRGLLSFALRAAGIGMFGILLALTASRGVAFAVGASAIGMVLTALLSVRTAASTLLRVVSGGAVLVIAGFTWLVGFADPAYIARNVARFGVNPFDSSENLRLRIWSSALGQLEGLDWVFGAGIGSFRTLAQRVGMNYYAHSVYVDVIVSLGLPAFLLLVAILAYVGGKALVARNSLGVGLVIFVMVSFSAYGAIGQTFFWSYLALAVLACTGGGLGGGRVPSLMRKHSGSTRGTTTQMRSHGLA